MVKIIKLISILLVIAHPAIAYKDLSSNNACLLDLQAYFSHDMTVKNSDIQGDTFVGGDAYLDHFLINGKLAVVNYLNANHGTIAKNSYASDRDFSFVGYRKHKKIKSAKFEELNTVYHKQMFKLSKSLSNLKANTEVSSNNNKLTIKASNELSVVNLTARELKNAYRLDLFGDENSLLIINIDNEDMEKAEFFRMTLELQGIKAQNIIYNFYNTRLLTLGMVGPLKRKYGTGIQGTLIAPLAKITFFMGVIDGGLYGKSLEDTRPTGQVDPLKVRSKLIRDLICH